MSSQNTHGLGTAPHANFCTGCGTQLGEGTFCPGCGRPAHEASPADPFPRYAGAAENGARVATGGGGGEFPAVPLLDEIEATARLSAKPGPLAPLATPPIAPTTVVRRRRWPIVAACCLLAVGAAVVALIIALSSGADRGGQSTRAAYVRKVGMAFAPVDHANQRLSNALAALEAHRPGQATAAVARAQSATSSARGALGALSPPAGSQQFTTSVRQALDREDTYLSAVATALGHPGNPGVSQLQSLAGSLKSSLEAVGAPLNGAAQNVTGADGLTAWAGGERQAAARDRNSGQGAAATAPPTSTAGVAAGPYATGRDCGAGLHAGPHTSCDFAVNVRDAYDAAPGDQATVEVFSPVTQQRYTMDCSLAGSGVTCSGGNGASVSW